ncbi:MAG TPA: RHS repeat-associated core domain-containing protein [Candidatus Dormibacteraeota bacterium]|nr:RHS repeat-associated core domain-containing protein [Candidatus Dormibacteraeota bacterium]
MTTPTMASGPSLPVPYDGVAEKVNLSNGNLSVSIPLLTLPGRAGNNLTIAISHDSQTYHLQTQAFDQGENDGQTNYMQYVVGYQPADSFPQMPGNPYWRLQIPTLIAYRELDAILSYCPAGPPCAGASPVYTDHFAYLDWDGTRYDFGNSELCYWVGPCSEYQPPASVLSPVHVSYVTGTTYGIPGLQSFSGYVKLDTTNTSNVVLTERDGTQVHFNLNLNLVNGPSPMTETTGQFLGPMAVAFTEIVDRNGNITTLTVSPSSYLLTDTLGRQVTINSSGVTYPDDTVSAGTRLIAFGPGPAATSNALSLTASGCNLNFPYETNSGLPPPTTTVSGSEGPTTTITFPNNEAITFGNDGLGALSFIQYPDGGYKRFTYGIETLAGYGTRYEQSGLPPAFCSSANAREVTAKFECPSGTCGCMQSSSTSACTGESQTTYTPTLINPIPATEEFGANQQNVVQSYDFNVPNNQGLLKKEVHSFQFGCWYVPLETSSQLYGGQGNLLRTTATSYANNCLSPSSVTTTYNDASPAVSTTVSYGFPTITLPSGGSTLNFDKPNSASYTDFTGSVLKSESTPFLWQSNSNYGLGGSYLLDLLSSKSVSGGGASATTTYGYDEYALQTSGVSSSLHTTGASPPGNQTSVHRWLNGSATQTTNCPVAISSGGYAVSYKQYFDTGSLYEFTDPCGTQAGTASHTWTYAYSLTNAGAYPTTITNPLGQSFQYGYDFSSGALTSATDPNTQTTTATYVLSRPTQVSYPDGGSTSFCYTDVGGATCSEGAPPYSIVTTQVISGSTKKTTTNLYDGFGRPSQTQLKSDPSGVDYTLTTYDALERKSQVYNPTRCSSITTNCGETTWGYSTTNYDALDRVISVVEQDGSSVSTGYGMTPASGSSRYCTAVTDEAGHLRKSCSDGLGRLTEVDEPGSGALTSDTPGTGSVTISGAEQGGGTPSTGSVYINNYYGSSSSSGSISISVAGTIIATVGYGPYEPGCPIAENLAAQASGNSLVTASSSCSSGSTGPDGTVNLTSIGIGSGTNYSVAATPCTGPVCSAVSTGPMTGGTGAPYDSGTVSVTVADYTASVSYGQGSTAASIASALASAFSGAGSPVTASVSNGTINLTANQTGFESNYALSASTTWNSQQFSNSSFTATPSGAMLTGGSDGTLGSGPLITLYTYDALGNLTGVTQNGSNSANARVRTFTYDSLSRLTSASNPESGNIAYAYDADGNVITKTAPLPNQTSFLTVTTTNTYDNLNRLIEKQYMDGSKSDPYTTMAQYAYDGNALSGCTIAPPSDTDSYPIGRRTSMCDGSGGTSWIHDKMGRVKQERRSIGAEGVNHYIDYTFNVDGSLGVLQTPPMKTLNYTYSGAGRATKLIDSTDNINFALSATYAPSGGLATATLGSASNFSGFSVTNYYNDRLQPILLSATNSQTGATVFSDCFDFHLGVAISSSQTPPCSVAAYNPPADNGNVGQIANNRTNTRTANFTYDSLNRIASGQSSGTGSTSWGETYVIDAWGNLTNINPISGKNYGENFQAAPASVQNQLNGFCNDAAGNLILNILCPQNPVPAYVYDAENRLVWTLGYRYIYDGDGKRVEKCQAASATTACPTSGTTGTLYWRGTGSDTLAETNLGGNQQEEYIFFNGQRIARRDISSTGGTAGLHFYFSDHLGSHAVVETLTTSGATSCDQDIDYYPYGGVEEDYCAAVAQNYKFTGKERDAESGLDMFGARYYASTMGRFTTPDWSSVPTAVPYAYFNNPQSLNLYGYSKNDPTTLTDPNGHCTNNGEQKSAWWCFWNLSDQDKKRYADQARKNLSSMRGLLINGQPASLWTKTATNQQLIDAQRQVVHSLALNDWTDLFSSSGLQVAAAMKTQWGWSGQQSYNEAKDLLNEVNTPQGTVDRTSLNGKVPTEEEAVKMIEDAGGEVRDVERVGHAEGGVTPHTYPHINYTTASGVKGTVAIQP